MALFIPILSCTPARSIPDVGMKNILALSESSAKTVPSFSNPGTSTYSAFEESINPFEAKVPSTLKLYFGSGELRETRPNPNMFLV